MLPWSDWVVPSAWDPGTKVKIPYTLHCPVSTPARCREHGTYGGQGKAVGCVPPTALLFEESRSSFIEMVTLAGLEPATSPAPVNKDALSPLSYSVVTIFMTVCGGAGA